MLHISKYYIFICTFVFFFILFGDHLLIPSVTLNLFVSVIVGALTKQHKDTRHYHLLLKKLTQTCLPSSVRLTDTWMRIE